MTPDMNDATLELDRLLPHCFDRSGAPMTLRQWIEVWENNPRAYRRVEATTVTLPDGSSRWVSTVWLGVDHSFGRGTRPLIFETMIFATDDATGDEGGQWRWHTEREARESHEIIVRRLRAGESLDDL